MNGASRGALGQAKAFGLGNTIFENTGILNGGCGEGTIFTFTSSPKPEPEEQASSGPLVEGQADTCGTDRQRLAFFRERYRSRRSRSPYRIKIDFRELLARNGIKSAKLRKNMVEEDTDLDAVTGVEKKKFYWNQRSKYLAHQRGRQEKNLGLSTRRRVSQLANTVCVVRDDQEWLSMDGEVGKELTDLQLTEMAARIREQEECRQALQTENELLKKELEKIRSGELNGSFTCDDRRLLDRGTAIVGVPARGKDCHPNPNRIKRDKLRCSKNGSSQDHRNHLSTEKIMGDGSNVVDKRRNMRAWLKSGYFDFSGTNSDKVPMARSFISLKGAISTVGGNPCALGLRQEGKRVEVGQKNSHTGSKVTKEHCNTHSTSGSENIGPWPQEALTRQPMEIVAKHPSSHSETSQESCTVRLTENSSEFGETCARDISIHADNPISASKSRAGQPDSGAVLDVCHRELSNGPQDAFSENDGNDQQQVQIQRGTGQQCQSYGLQEETRVKADLTEKSHSLQESENHQISAWLSDVLASVTDNRKLERSVSGNGFTGAWQGSRLEAFSLALRKGKRAVKGYKGRTAVLENNRVTTTVHTGGNAEKDDFHESEQLVVEDSDNVNCQIILEVDATNDLMPHQAASGVEIRAISDEEDCFEKLTDSENEEHVCKETLHNETSRRLEPATTTIFDNELVSARTSLEDETFSCYSITDKCPGRHKSCFRETVPGQQNQEFRGQAAGSWREFEAGPKSWKSRPIFIDCQMLPGNGNYDEKEVMFMEPVGVEVNHFPVQSSGIKAMLKDFHMKERCLSKLRRMPIIFRSKNGLSHSWLRLSHEKKSILLQKVASNEVLRKEVNVKSGGFPLRKTQKKGKISGRQREYIDVIETISNADEVRNEMRHSSPQMDEQYLCDQGTVKKNEVQTGIQQVHPSQLADAALQTGGGEFSAMNGNSTDSIPICDIDCEEMQTLESQQLMTCCSFNGLPLGFGSFGREKSHGVQENRCEKNGNTTCSPNEISDKHDGNKSFFGRSKMKGILSFRRDKRPSPAHNRHSYTSLSVIVSNDKRMSRKKSVGKVRLNDSEPTPEECEQQSDGPLTEDGDSQHDSPYEEDNSNCSGSRSKSISSTAQKSFMSHFASKFLQHIVLGGNEADVDRNPTNDDVGVAKGEKILVEENDRCKYFTVSDAQQFKPSQENSAKGDRQKDGKGMLETSEPASIDTEAHDTQHDLDQLDTEACGQPLGARLAPLNRDIGLRQSVFRKKSSVAEIESAQEVEVNGIRSTYQAEKSCSCSQEFSREKQELISANSKRHSMDKQINTTCCDQVLKEIPPAEHVFLERFSKRSLYASGQSSSSSRDKTDPCMSGTAAEPYPPLEISTLTSLLLDDTPRQILDDSTGCSTSDKVRQWTQSSGVSPSSAHDLGHRCHTAPSPSLPFEEPKFYEYTYPRPTTARPTHFSPSQESTTFPTRYDSSSCSYAVHGSSSIQAIDPSMYPHSQSNCDLCLYPAGAQLKPHFGCLQNHGFPRTSWNGKPQHELAAQTSFPSIPWPSCDPNSVQYQQGSMNFSHHSFEPPAEPYPPPFKSHKDSTTVTLPKVSSSQCPSARLVQQSLNSKPVHHMQASELGSLTQPKASHLLENFPAISQNLNFDAPQPLAIPFPTGQIRCAQECSTKAAQPRQHLHSSQEPAFCSLRKQAQTVRSVRSVPNTCQQSPSAVPSDLSSCFSEIPCASASQSLHRGREAVLAVASSSGCSTPRQMLWLSEEETEIIRQIRLSKVKGTTTASYSSVTAEPCPSTFYSKVTAADSMDAMASHHGRSFSRCSNLSSCSADDSIKESDTNWKSAEDDTLCRPGEARKKLSMLEKQTKMVIAACRHSAASCIQKWWKKYLQIKAEVAASELSDMPLWLQQLPDSKLRSGGATSVQVMQRRTLSQKKETSRQRAAIAIQRWWRKLKRREKELKCSPKKLPNSFKPFYNLIKSRHLSKGLVTPSYDRFLRLMERVQAATEGARVRRRLKSRRLQAMKMEIKEIRALLVDMSLDTREIPPSLLPQLYNQLQQKLLQLHTALNGPEKDARFVLRRSPASPLVICTPRPSPSCPARAAPPKFDQALLRSSTGSLADALSTANSHIQSGDNRKHRLISPPKKSQSSVTVSPTLISEQMVSKDAQQLGKSAELAYGQLYQQKDTSAGASSSRADAELQRFSQTEENMMEIKLQMENMAGLEEQYDDEHVEQPDRPKRPYLKRKSIVMAPQKLDWSKVKPMVSSRLEPELRTKLSRNKHKGVNVSSSRKVLTNYSKVKSRLFNYEAKSCSLNGSIEDADIADFTEVNHQNGAGLLERADEVASKDCANVRKNKIRRSSASDGNLTVRSSVSAHSKKSMDDPAQSKAPDVTSQQKAEEKSGKSKQHSNRYGRSDEVLQTEQKEDGGQEECRETSKPTVDVFSKEGWVASWELENMLKGVMSLKSEKQLSMTCLFRPSQEISMIPRLTPASRVLNASNEETAAIFEMLCNEGRSNKSRPNKMAATCPHKGLR